MGALNVSGTDARPVFKTVAEMRDFSDFNLEDEYKHLVMLLGTSSAYDGGGGMFLWDKYSVESDDSLTTIKLTNTTTGRFKRVDAADLTIRGITATHLSTEYAATKTANYSIDPNDGYVQVITDNTGSLELAVTDNFNASRLRVVVLVKGTGVATMTFTGITWAGIGSGGVEPDLTSRTEIHFELFKIGGTIYGYAFGEVES